MNVVYAFCRKTDDIVDEDNLTKQAKEEKLLNWKNSLKAAFEVNSENGLLNEVADCAYQFNIPRKPFFDMIDGMEMDLTQNRYSTFEELKSYCYKVASTVGLMTIPIFGYKNSETQNYAINLGIALQLTNILRDVKIDSYINRIYLPTEDLAKFDYSEQDLTKGIYNENFVKLMQFQADRAKEFYKIADSYLRDEDKSSMFTARAMQYIYYRLLDKIEQEKFNVFDKKIRVSTINKLFIALSVWIKYKLIY